jgi:hypothetical protein
VAVEGEPVDDRRDEAAVGDDLARLKNGRFDAVAIEARCSRSVITWNKSSAPLPSSAT